jgi:hypothetical protein
MSNLLDEIKANLNEQQEQRSEGWTAARLGKFTASQIYRIMANVKRPMTEDELAEAKKTGSKAKTIEDENLLSDGAKTYINEVVWETLSGQSIESGSSRATQYGEEMEGYAREAFEIAYKKKVNHAGFKAWKDFPNDAGGSSDGDVEAEDAIVEFKNPFNGGIFISYCLMDLHDLPEDYYIQCQSNMIFSNARLCYFVAHDSRLKPEFQTKVIEMPADKRTQDRIKLKLMLAIAEKERIINLLKPTK